MRKFLAVLIIILLVVPTFAFAKDYGTFKINIGDTFPIWNYLVTIEKCDYKSYLFFTPA